MPPGTLPELRQEISVERVREIFRRMEERLKSPDTPSVDSLHRAIDYSRERRKMQERQLEDPHIPIDNTAERAVRPVTVGRINCLCICAPDEGRRMAGMADVCKVKAFCSALP